MNRAFSKILILVILVVLAGGGIFAWQYFGVPEWVEELVTSEEVEEAMPEEEIVPEEEVKIPEVERLEEIPEAENRYVIIEELSPKENDNRIYNIARIDLSTKKKEDLFKIKTYASLSSSIKDFKNIRIARNGNILFKKDYPGLQLWDNTGKEIKKLSIAEPISSYVLDRKGEKIAYVGVTGEEIHESRVYVIDKEFQGKIELNLAEIGFFKDHLKEYEVIGGLSLEGFLDSNRLIISKIIYFKGVEGGYYNLLILNIKDKKIEKELTDQVLLDYYKAENTEFLLTTVPDKGCCGEVNASNNITKVVNLKTNEEIILIDEHKRHNNKGENLKNYGVNYGWFSENGEYIFLGEISAGMPPQQNSTLIFSFDNKNFSSDKILEKDLGDSNFRDYVSLDKILITKGSFSSIYGVSTDDLFILDLQDEEEKNISRYIYLIGAY